jgi:hypothetical protein
LCNAHAKLNCPRSGRMSCNCDLKGTSCGRRCNRFYVRRRAKAPFVLSSMFLTPSECLHNCAHVPAIPLGRGPRPRARSLYESVCAHLRFRSVPTFGH